MLRRFLESQQITGRVIPEESVRVLVGGKYVWVFDRDGEVVHQTPSDETGTLEVDWEAQPGDYFIYVGRSKRWHCRINAELTVHALSEEAFGWTR